MERNSAYSDAGIVWGGTPESSNTGFAVDATEVNLRLDEKKMRPAVKAGRNRKAKVQA
jgi:hypothetical protein